ncbi:MAG: GNAT family N-acetyltransferase [Streptosporangiaceae bacterium]
MAAVVTDVVQRNRFGFEIHLSHVCDPVWLGEARQFRVIKEPFYVLDLAGGFEEVWREKFRSSVRTSVRKAERSALDVEIDRSGRLLEVFYDIYVKSIERWSVTMHEPLWFAKWHVMRATPLSMLVTVAKHFGENCTTWLLRSKGDPVAAIIVLRTGSRVYGWRAAMDKPLAAPLHAMEYLQWLVIEAACRDGCRFYDLGVANPESGLANFKKKFGATLHFSYYLQAERVPIQRTIGRSKNLARKTINRLR